MNITIKDTKVNYIRYGNIKKDTIIYLHGWGQNIQMMKPLSDAREKMNDVIVIDLPGHGESEEPKFAWTVDDYVEFLKEFCDELKVKNPILVGHSFGGKISLLYASKYNVKKLVLFGSPFRKEIKKMSFKTKVLKTAKKIPGLKMLEGFAKKHIGSTDYKNASPIMREILVKTVNYDITDKIKNIKCPTLIVWGDMDEAVNIEDAYILENLIEDSGVVVYPGCTHYAYLERLGQTINVLNSFLGK